MHETSKFKNIWALNLNDQNKLELGKYYTSQYKSMKRLEFAYQYLGLKS